MPRVIEATIEVRRGEMDEAQDVTVEVGGDITLGTMATYWDPGDPTEVEILRAVVVESNNPDFKPGTTIELTPEEIERAERALTQRAEESGIELPDSELPDEELPDND